MSLAIVPLLAALAWAPDPGATQTPAATQPATSEAQTPPQPQAQPPAVGEDERVKADDIDELLKDGKVFFLDVREPKELEEMGTLEGYVNIPLGELEKRLGELPKDKAILTA